MIRRWISHPVYSFALAALFPLQFFSANFEFFSLFSFVRLTAVLLIVLLLLFLLVKALAGARVSRG